jgi:hypothetical protein
LFIDVSHCSGPVKLRRNRSYSSEAKVSADVLSLRLSDIDGNPLEINGWFINVRWI